MTLLVNLINLLNQYKMDKGFEIKKIILYEVPKDKEDLLRILLIGAFRDLLKEFRELAAEAQMGVDMMQEMIFNDLTGRAVADET